MNRNEFIRSAGRITILALMTATAGVFVYRKKITLYSDCSNSKYCKGCKDLKRCALPEAETERKNGQI